MTTAGESGTKRRGRVSVVGVIGEILITVGLVALLYVAWQMWIGDVIYAAQARQKGQALSEQWAQEFTASSPVPSDPPRSASPDGSAAQTSPVDPPVLAQPADAQTFATIRIPRFGPDYIHEVAGGTSRATTLDTARVGHYDGSEMPGQIGNFALAAHRTTFGALFNRIPSLKVGDAIVIETADGWYTYRFRNHQYVVPTQVDVLLDLPQKPEVAANGRYLTMTSCSPIGSLAERMVGYSVFESYTPRSEGEPASLAAPTNS
jgi:sortase A